METVKASVQYSRERLEETQRGTIPWWKPDVGWNYVRILPPHRSMQREDGLAPFFWLVPVHFLSGKPPITCPRTTTGKRCPICEQAFALRRDGLKDEASAFFPTWRAYLNIVVLEDEDSEIDEDADVLVWGPGRGLIEQIMDEIEENEGIDVTDPDAGRIVGIKRRGTTKEDTRYAVRIGRKPVPVPRAVLGRVHDLTRLTMSLETAVAGGLIDVSDMGVIIEGTAVALPDAPPDASPPARASLPRRDAPPVEESADSDDDEDVEEVEFETPRVSIKTVAAKKESARARLAEMVEDDE